MPDYGLSGKACLVTGGGSGIGRATAITLARSGGLVAVCDIVASRAEAVAAEIAAAGGTAIALPGDVSDPDVAGRLVAAVAAEYGRFDVGVNNAGIGGVPELLADYPPKAWRELMSVNLDGVFFCMRAEITALRATGQGGSIVNMASILGVVGHVRTAAYVTAKHAVIGLTKAAALDHAPDGIRVNAIGPGFIETPALMAHVDDAGLAALAAVHPIGRLGRAEEVAELVAWLASDASSFCTGAFYPLDGGFTAV